MTYRATEAFLAVRYDQPTPFKFITISPGSLITLQSEVHPSGLVSVLYDGQIAAAFMRDIDARAEMVGIAPTATSSALHSLAVCQGSDLTS
jgi:hypothetical protein